MPRAGLTSRRRARGWFPVVVAGTIHCRRSRTPFERCTIGRSLLGRDGKALLVEPGDGRSFAGLASMMHRLRAPALCLAALQLGACYQYRSRALGPGGTPVASVPEGSAVDVRFASPRRLATPDVAGGALDQVLRVRGIVERARDDTLVVRVERAAEVGSAMRDIDPAVRVPLVVGRDMAVRVRELSRTRSLLVAVGILLLGLVVLEAS